MQTVFSVSCQRRKSNLICQNSPEVISDFEPINVQFQIKVLFQFSMGFHEKKKTNLGIKFELENSSEFYDFKDFCFEKNLIQQKPVHTSPD